ncbi:MAG: hypothetical protein M1833_004904 [Piccolia ochrophora]|nr:MAG: hypothetical protein M1833_004904 [Piccolia ochrophora]
MPSTSSLTTTTIINSSNPTLVATWDVGTVPENAEASEKVVLRFNGNPETLGPNGDRRQKVDSQHFRPGGKYRAICKLFMGYMGSTNTYVGTGWLIADDLLVTAGHCSFDEEEGYLKWMKVYIGYAGPESVGTATCQYRQAASVAMPAEYLKAATAVHDVSFVKLRARFDGISRSIQYEDTPQLETITLGVVGYPGELSFGNYMYEHWSPVEVDLAKSRGILQYTVDTTGGQSGSPVLRANLKSIGVHVRGGWPNQGSVIGTLGNIFAEYLLATKAHSGVTIKGITIVNPTTQSAVKGFKMMSVASLSKESARWTSIDGVNDGTGADGRPSTGKRQNGALSDDEATIGLMNGETEVAIAKNHIDSALARLFGSSEVGKVHSGTSTGIDTRPKGRVASGSFLDYPEILEIKEDAPATAATNADLAAATLDKKATEDIQTLFFINFPPNFGKDSTALASFRELDDLIKSWQSWSSALCEGKVQEMIDGGKLPNGSDAWEQSARSTYRAKVFDYLMRSATWFAKTFDQVVSKKIACKKIEFHGEILKAALQGFTVPTSVMGALEAVLEKIAKDIELGGKKAADGMQYWIMMTRYVYQPMLQSVQPIIRVISFKVNSEAAEFAVGKASYSDVNIQMALGQYQCDFNSKIYRAIASAYDQELIKKGQALAALKTSDIQVEV